MPFRNRKGIVTEDGDPDYLMKKGIAPGETRTGLSPQYEKGAVIMGVYTLAGKTAPQLVAALMLSGAGQRLYDSIKNMQVPQCASCGVYTGFVDNKNTEGDTNPVGPRSTARFLAPAPGILNPDPHPRWLPPPDSPLWIRRKRKNDLDSSAYTVGGVLILDAVTLHKPEIDRIKSTLAVSDAMVSAR